MKTEIEYTYDQYPEDVLSGKILACEAIQLACKRYMEFKARDDMYFDEADVQQKIRVVSRLKHFTGSHNGKPFLLLPWQQWTLASIFGFKYKETGMRVTKNVFIMMSRKQGKTAYAAALSILCAIADNEANAEIELVANSRQQAKIAFKHTSNFCESADPKNKIFKRYRDTINIPSTKSTIQVLSSDAMGNDGYNASCFVLDEFHAAKNWDLYNVLVSSQGMRDQPLAIIITTAGFLLNGYPCFEQRETCLDILRGLKTDDSQFSAIYELDPDDDWKDENVWIKCAPSLGQTVKKDYLRGQVNAVTNNPSLEVGVKTKNFNMFCQSKNIWIPDKYLKGVWQKVNLEDFKDEESYIGVDLSSVSDLTSTTIMFPPNPDRKMYPDKYVFKNFIYIPDENIEESVNVDMYKLWKRQGYLLVTSGNVVDYDFILADQLKMYQNTYVNGIFYDEWNASSWAVDATAEGLPLYPYSQATGNFNRPTKTFEMLVRQGKVIIDFNPCVRWCFNNVELKIDQNENVKPVKAGNVISKKIDPIISSLEALGGYLNMNMKGGSSDGMVYNA
jgi:phage terminase large subunit-like protein